MHGQAFIAAPHAHARHHLQQAPRRVDATGWPAPGSAMTRDITTETEAQEFLEWNGPDDPTPEPEGDEAWAPVPPTRSLALALLEAVLTPSQRRRMLREASLCVVVQAPSPAWCEPLRSAFRSIGQWAHVELRDGTAKYKRRPEEGAAEIANALAGGVRVLGISPSPETQLPPCLVASADIRITLPRPTERVIRQVIREATGSNPRKFPAGIVEGLDFPDIIACIRMGTTAASCVHRLQAASLSRGATDPSLADAPDVTAMHGFGEAALWARNLLADLSQYRAGHIRFDQISRTLVLASEPGLGKTTWVRALAKTANLPLVQQSLSSIFSSTTTGGYLGDIAARISKTFADARNISCPVLMFLDEIDALPDRNSMDVRGRDYWTPLINLFLLELDQSVASSGSRIIVIAATNHLDRLDPALVRPGRIHPTIRIPRPDAAALVGILRQHLGDDLAGVDLARMAGFAVGATGADVMAWVRDARRVARVAGRPMVEGDLLALIAPPDHRPEIVRWRTAVHEAGHAAIAWALGQERVTMVSIVPGPNRGGVTMTEDIVIDVRSRSDVEGRVITALAGRAAEAIFGLGYNSGATDDLRIATRAAASIHLSMGLGNSLLHRAGPDEIVQTLILDGALRKEVSSDLDRLFAKALLLVEEHRGLVHAIATTLMTVRQLDGAGFDAIVAERAAAPVPEGRRRG